MPAAQERDARDTAHPDYDPRVALAECHDLWASGAWPDDNAIPNLGEVMLHVERLVASDGT